MHQADQPPRRAGAERLWRAKPFPGIAIDESDDCRLRPYETLPQWPAAADRRAAPYNSGGAPSQNARDRGAPGYQL
jgi:hypothetical protein